MKTKKSDWTRREFLKTTGTLASGLALSTIAPVSVFSEEKPKTLVIGFQGGDNLKFAKKYVDAPFKEKYGIQVKHYTSKHAQRLVKLRAEVPNPSFHCYFSKANFLVQAVDLGLLEPIGPEIIPAYNEIYPEFRSEYFVGGPFVQEGILYNPDAMGKPTSLASLWDPKYKGKVGTNRFVGRMVMLASMYATGGKEINNEKKAWPALEALILDQKAKYITSSEQVGAMFEQGEIVISTYWRARAFSWKKAGLPIDFSSPKEGSLSEFWGWGIPKGVSGATKKYAGLYISSFVGARVGQEYAKTFSYPCANSTAKYPPELSDALITKDEFAAMKAPDYRWVSQNIEPWTEKYNKLLSRG